MHEGKESEIRQQLFSTIGNGYLGRAFQRHFAIVCFECMRRQPFDQAAAFDTANRRQPAVLRKCIGQARAECVCGIGP